MENTNQSILIETKPNTRLWMIALGACITENLAEHQNKIKFLDSVEGFFDVSTGILLLVRGLN